MLFGPASPRTISDRTVWYMTSYWLPVWLETVATTPRSQLATGWVSGDADGLAAQAARVTLVARVVASSGMRMDVAGGVGLDTGLVSECCARLVETVWPRGLGFAPELFTGRSAVR